MADYDEGAAVAVADIGDAGESGKLKMIVSLVKKCLGVKDIASMRLSLPASLLEPIPNLEYWHYLDRPDLFAAINDSDDAFERMLAVLRFTFSKDLKHARGKPCKPYNSVLGEHFRAHWDVIPVDYASDPSLPPIQHLYVGTAAPETPTRTPGTSLAPSRLASPRLGPSASLRSDGASEKSEKSARPPSVFSTASRGGTTAATSVAGNADAQVSRLSLGGELLEADEPGPGAPRARVRVAFLTEQISHHPPVSAFYAACPARGLALSGVDQIAARVSGTAVRVGPGELNKGIFVAISAGPGKGETYHITHQTAAVNGLLRGSPYVAMCESTVITCAGGAPGSKLRAILEYKEESWIGKAVYHVEGVVFAHTPGDGADEWTKVKHVPKARVLAQVDGSWRHLLRWRRAPDAEWTPLLDLSTLHVVPKAVRPLAQQGPRESRRMWEPVTSRLERKEFGEATKHKQAIEQRQRDDAAERKRKGVEFVPAYFETDISSGQPRLTAEGRNAIEVELKEPLVAASYTLEGDMTA